MERGETGQRAHVLLLTWEVTEQTLQDIRAWRRVLGAGCDVHVVSGDRNLQDLDLPEGVTVHGVEAPPADALDAAGWTTVLGIRMAALGSVVLSAHGPFALIQAGDGLVKEGAQMLAETSRCPLVTAAPGGRVQSSRPAASGEKRPIQSY